MSNVDEILEHCLTDLLNGASTLEECLARYPEHAEHLEPLLRTASRVHAGSRVRPSPVFRARTRASLTLHMQAHPRRRVVRASSPFWRMLAGAAALVLTLFVTGTVYAQGALPGDAFYEWKLTSEDAWRIVSIDPLTTDLRIANRRINEMNTTVNDQARWARALQEYEEVRVRLEVELGAETAENILPPVEVFTYPDITATPVPVSDPQQVEATATPSADGKDTEKDQKEKDKEKEKKDGLPDPTKKPKKIPTIQIPPPRK